MKSEIASYVGVLLERGQLAKAEEFLIDLEAKDDSGSGNRFSINSGNPGAMLAELYLKAGRFADVIALLDGLRHGGEPIWKIISRGNRVEFFGSDGLQSVSENREEGSGEEDRRAACRA